jgi:hypothetical protein
MMPIMRDFTTRVDHGLGELRRLDPEGKRVFGAEKRRAPSTQGSAELFRCPGCLGGHSHQRSPDTGTARLGDKESL